MGVLGCWTFFRGSGYIVVSLQWHVGEDGELVVFVLFMGDGDVCFGGRCHQFDVLSVHVGTEDELVGELRGFMELFERNVIDIFSV